MTDERKYRYLRFVLYMIAKRKWKNGYVTTLAATALARTTDVIKPIEIKTKATRVNKTFDQELETIRSLGLTPKDYRWNGSTHIRR